MFYTLSVNKEKIKSFFNENKSMLTSGIFHIDNIPNKKLINASKTYSIESNSIIALYDTTFLKLGKDGLMFSDKFIGVKHTFCSADKISYEDLIKSGIDEDSKSIIINNTYRHLSKDEFIRFFIKLKIFLIVEDMSYKSIYENYIDEKLNNIKLKIQNKSYRKLEEEFLILDKIIVKKYDIKTDAVFYYIGCLLYLEKFDFQEVDNYYKKLKELNQLDDKALAQLENDIEKRKIQYEFNLLDNKKTNFIKNHNYNEAISVVNDQKLLNIKPVEELDDIILNIQKLKKDYIDSLENKVTESLLNNRYNETFNILEKLKAANPEKSYIKYYIAAQIGVFDFANAMSNIKILSETDETLANELRDKLQLGKDKASVSIIEAVKTKDYNFFKENEILKTLKDKWGMTALMHFIINEDIEGVSLLKDTFNIEDTNVVGHSALNLVSLSDSYDFKNQVFRILDKNLNSMVKKYKTKNTIGRFKKLALNGGEILNEKSIIRYNMEEATSSYQNSINKSIEDISLEIKEYTDELINKNFIEFKNTLINPKDYNENLKEIENLKIKIKEEIDSVIKNKESVKNSFKERFNKALENNLDKYIKDAATIEVGEKDEFETSLNYKNRKEAKMEEIRANYEENNYIKERLELLKEQIKKEIESLINNLEYTVKNKEEQVKNLESKTKEYEYLIYCRKIVDINEVFNYYYYKYKSNIDIGTYNADTEIFASKLYNKEIAVKVPLPIAKEFKMNFKNLNPTYEKMVSEENKEIFVQHIFLYEFNGEKIKIPFLKQ